MRDRNFICQNDLIDATKNYKGIELKAFYNMLYCAKEQTMYTIGFKDEEVTYMDADKITGFLGNKHFTRNDLINIITKIPKGIYSKNGKSYIAVFSFISFNEDTNEFEFKINADFKPYINDIISNFTILELKRLSAINGVYSQRLYEFISKNKGLKISTMKIEDFKEYFHIPKSYSMCNIDQRVLTPALKEINSVTDFKVVIKKLKESNRVTHIRFYIQQAISA